MSYESYDPYEYNEYDPNQNQNQGYPGEQQQPYYGEQQYEQQPYEGQQPYQEQQQYDQSYEGQQPYEGQPYQEQPYESQPYEGQYQEPYQQQPDQQWAQSGLGWEQHAWDEARLGVSPLQEAEYPQQQERPAPGGFPYAQVNELSGTDFQQYQADLPRDLPVPDYPPEYDEYGPGPADPAAGRGRRGRASQAPEYGEYDEYAGGRGSGEGSEFPHQRSDDIDSLAESAISGGSADEDPGSGRSRKSDKSEKSAPSGRDGASGKTAAPATAPGRGSFGAAGIAVVAAIAAIASSGALLIVVALIQAAIAFGWQQAVGTRDEGRIDRRAVALTALTGWAATAAVYKLSLSNDFLGVPVTLGIGFVLLAADQTIRRNRPLGDGDRVAGLAIAVTGGLFAVLPAGFVVSERTDSALTGACASAAALGVLCCALLGRNAVRGIVVGLVLGAAVGAYAAKTLQANGGLEAGAVGGAVAALGAATAVGAFDRIAAEAEVHGSVRIVSQVLPVALAAVGALIASAVFR